MTYTLNLTDENIDILIDKYRDFKIENVNEYTIFRAKISTTTITVFSTNKVVLQGNNAYKTYVTICNGFGIIPKDEEHTKVDAISDTLFNLSIIGTDEVGTGDYFGPIVVSACFISKDQILQMKKLGVKDSKKLSDDKILEIGKVIHKETINSSVVLSNRHFNDLMKTPNMNMNKIKSFLHNRAIRNILEKDITYDKIVIDAFTTKDKYFEYLNNKTDVISDNVYLEEKAEDKYVAVGAASILARYFFLTKFDSLIKEYGYKLPKGASDKVDRMIHLIKSDGREDILYDIAKLSFKNTHK